MISENDLLIEGLAVRAWPALVTSAVNGWLLRATPGVARRRSNSALPPAQDALAALPEVEQFYRQRHAPVLVQLSPAHRHKELDSHLADRGYLVSAPTLVLRASLSPAELGQQHSAPNGVELGERDEQWTQALEAIDGRVDAAGDLVMDRIPARTVFAKAVQERSGVGVGAGVLENGWLGVFAMGTDPSYRRRGVASAVLRTLLEWAQREGAHSAWLQVEANNAAALALYEAHGFQLSHRYHYRVLS
jgi:GNAT superfamily N-acetyltransferase